MKRLQTDNSNLTKQISQLQMEVRRSQGNVASLTERAKILQDNNTKAAQESRAKQAELAKLGQELKNAKTLSQNANQRLMAATNKAAEMERAAAAEKETATKSAAELKAWLPDGYSQIFRWCVFGPSGLKDYGSATLRSKI